MSAEWVGECSRGLKYVPVSLRNLGVGPTQTVYYPNRTYFFTSFSSGTRYGIRDRKGGLCEKGVRLILEVRDSTVRVPLKPRFESGSHELQVPVQRVSYGGMPEKMFQQNLHHNQLSMRTRVSPDKDDLDSNSYVVSEEEDNFLFEWPWLESSISRQIVDDNTRIQKRRNDDDEISWDPLTREYFKYSGN
ncbi:hypothetical protein TELCIR_17120 [Teladorsagia circumcincta]|uniref:Ephrin RBD domain-containing protein n=1 Tax=Teladorsagia circumcincta TaxID=45464 RepID=A0A2G9TTM4_TELCI|nr:hypothetical protein TELCIR_17120 [Teladorsagia circumcincta]